MTTLTLAPPLAPLAGSNQYGNPLSEQDAYAGGKAPGREYAPQQSGLFSPRNPHSASMTDPQGYHDPGSFSDPVNGPTSYQDSKPYVPTLNDYAQHGMYEHPEKARQTLMRKRAGRAREMMTDPLFAERARKDDKINDTEQEGGMAYGDAKDLERRYGLMPAANHAEEVDFNGYNANLFNVEPKFPPVKTMFFSRENIRRLGDYFDSRGLGRPSAENLREYQQLIWADNPDFVANPGIGGFWRRDANSVKMQLKRLNALLIGDMIPILESAKESWHRYQFDAYFGYGYSLIDNPVNTSTKRNANSLEFNSRLF